MTGIARTEPAPSSTMVSGEGPVVGPGWVSWTGLGTVAGAAGVLSFASVRDLAAAAAYPAGLAWLLPVVIDTTAVVASRIWLGRRGPIAAVGYARALALTAAIVTIAANITQHALVAYRLAPAWWLVAGLAAVPPAGLVAVAHLVALLTRPSPAHQVDQLTEPAADQPAPLVSSAPAGPTGSPPAPVSAPVALPGAGDRAGGGAGELLVAVARRAVAAGRARGVRVGRGRLARELGIGEHQARQLLRHLAHQPGQPGHSGQPADQVSGSRRAAAGGR